MQDLNDMRYFARVMAAGSFSAAARELGVPKSTLSRRVARLEEELGVRLIYRTTRRLNLTDIGREYLHHCESVLAAAEAASDTVLQARRTPRGRVRLTAPMDIARNLLAEALPPFMAENPEVAVELEATNRRVNLVEEGVDIALRVRPSLEDSSLIMRSIATSPSVMIAAPALVSHFRPPAHPRELARWPSLSMAFADGRHRWRFRGPEGESLTLPHSPRLVTDDMQVLRQAAVGGVGVVSLPAFMARPALEAGELELLLPEWRLPEGQMHLVYPHRRGLLPAVRGLIDHLVGELPRLARDTGLSSPG